MHCIHYQYSLGGGGHRKSHSKRRYSAVTHFGHVLAILAQPVEEHQITIMDVTNVDADGNAVGTTACQVQWRTQVAYERNEASSLRAQGITVFADISRDFTPPLLQKRLFDAVLQPHGFIMIGPPQWAGGDGSAQTTSNQIKFTVATPGVKPQDAKWYALHQLAIPTMIHTSEQGEVQTGGHGVLISGNMSKQNAKELKICKDCLCRVDEGCAPTCKSGKQRAETAAPPRAPKVKFTVLQEQHAIAAQGITAQDCLDWTAGRACRRGVGCQRKHRPEVAGDCMLYAKHGECKKEKCPYKPSGHWAKRATNSKGRQEKGAPSDKAEDEEQEQVVDATAKPPACD